MEQKFEEIKLSAKHGFLIYCDGYTAQIAGMKPANDQEGNDVWDFVLNPSDELIKRYKLKPNNKGNMLYTAQLPYDMVVQLNPDPAWNRWLCLLNYNGEPVTHVTDVLKGSAQQEIIKNLKKEKNELKLRLEVVNEEIGLIKKNHPKWMKENVISIIEQMAPVMTKLLPEKKNE